MAEISINIVAFDIPYPADYGGSIDIFYKLKALHANGVQIILHCFKYNKSEQPELEKYCQKVIYYKRQKGVRFLFSRLPYIVITRKNKQLLKNLSANDYPILFEGLHSCYYLNSRKLKGRRKIVRMHNIEHYYYRGLADASIDFFRRIYYGMESRKLRRYEKVLKHASQIISIIFDDQKYFADKYGKSLCIPAFHSFDHITVEPGRGSYFLYHGNLSVEENQKAVRFLLYEVFNNLDIKLIIAGKNPEKDIENRSNKLENVELIANPSDEKMYELLRNAQGCVLPTFQDTGLKLKLLISLFSSRFVVVNNTMVKHTALADLCEIAYTASEFQNALRDLSIQEFTAEMVEQRKHKLEKFTNQYNSKELIKILTSE
ncbi:glycosyltransferase [Maribellus sp. YY47]|uniref:glycosyltransferase n=1 Tax=Maribellus sp. YY47 TaxID=2929486 RepID=UPI002000C014|nr:glycosyltransferase [Maribellus sp. YY47]MCK3684420.1 glycosyltransferase [Maribellus sp. YY47]